MGPDGGYLAGFQLGDEKQSKGLALIATYVVDSDAARTKAIASGDMQSPRSAGQELSGKLDTAMGEILSADQLTKWKEATARGGRGGGGGGPGAGAPPAAAPSGSAAPVAPAPEKK